MSVCSCLMLPLVVATLHKLRQTENAVQFLQALEETDVMVSGLKLVQIL